MIDERVAIFIDGSNLYHCLQQEFGPTKVDMQKLAEKLCGGRRLIRTYYYNAAHDQKSNPSAYAEQQKFFNALTYIPYFEVKLGRLERRGDTMIEKGVDLRMAVDMLLMALTNAYDTAILVTGDGDFSYVVEEIKERGKHVENACPRTGRAKELRRACDKFIEIDKAFLQDILLDA